MIRKLVKQFNSPSIQTYIHLWMRTQVSKITKWYNFCDKSSYRDSLIFIPIS
jgi:hypothetical protein